MARPAKDAPPAFDPWAIGPKEPKQDKEPRQCGDCRFFRITSYDGASSGECFFRPPIVEPLSNGEFLTYRPQVKQWDVCAEHTRADEATGVEGVTTALMDIASSLEFLTQVARSSANSGR